MNDIQAKIAKLLALAESSNENEAKLALLRARELMAKYKLDMKDLKKPEARRRNGRSGAENCGVFGMKLSQLLPCIDQDVHIWIAVDPSKSTGLYFGPVSEVPPQLQQKYDVVEIYPEHYPAIYNFAGISIIVSPVSERTNP